VCKLPTLVGESAQQLPPYLVFFPGKLIGVQFAGEEWIELYPCAIDAFRHGPGGDQISTMKLD